MTEGNSDSGYTVTSICFPDRAVRARKQGLNIFMDMVSVLMGQTHENMPQGTGR